MRERQTKEQFTNEMKERIEMVKQVLKVYDNVYLPTLKKFDGKVYNMRFINALREATKSNDKLHITERNGHGEIEIRLRRGWNYTDYVCLYVKCNLNKDWRIDYDLSVNDEFAQNWLKNFKEEIDDYKNAYKNYDRYIRVVEKLEKSIKEWNDLPYRFRHNIETCYMSK